MSIRLGETHVNIPNTLVKPFSADGTGGLSVGRVGLARLFCYFKIAPPLCLFE